MDVRSCGVGRLEQIRKCLTIDSIRVKVITIINDIETVTNLYGQ